MARFFSWLLEGVVTLFDTLFAFMINVLAAFILATVDIILGILTLLLSLFPPMPSGGNPINLVFVGADSYIPITQLIAAIGLYFVFYQLLGSVAVVKFIRGS